ncbi:MAG: CDP-alcohol phosphatidyltransferase family protein [Acetatifactor muris]|nr:CDP-alcohol phosphatidyltransferase family protein [Acetatifactor muris]MCM1525703.1 CDP-alcohol phosphatidyltransferase family protein [Bacteroides sp.]
MLGCYNKSVILTYAGVALSLTGICGCLAGQWDMAMICLIAAGICDLFDGMIARKCKRTDMEKQFGIQIDSLADVVSFLIFPAVMLLGGMGTKEMARVSFTENPWNAAGLVLAILYVLAGIIRLAWFNIHTATDVPARHYEGLPVTYAALILPLFYVLWKIVLFPGYLWLPVYGILAFCFVWRVPMPKPTGIWYGVFAALAVLVTILIAVV